MPRKLKEERSEPPSNASFRPIKVQTTVRIDADVLHWLKSKGPGHISRINTFLRDRMLAERKP